MYKVDLSGNLLKISSYFLVFGKYISKYISKCISKDKKYKKYKT